jgi:hypothetical protein
MQRVLFSTALSLSALLASVSSAQTDLQNQLEADDEVTEITVSATRVANERPAGSYTTPVTALRFDPSTEIQSRGIAEGQSDVTVRGSVFENTGFKLGAVTMLRNCR